MAALFMYVKGFKPPPNPSEFSPMNRWPHRLCIDEMSGSSQRSQSRNREHQNRAELISCGSDL